MEGRAERHPTMKRIIETFRVYEYSRVTETDDKPSLPPMPGATVYDTDGDEVITHGRRPGLVKCAATRMLKAAGAK